MAKNDNKPRVLSDVPAGHTAVVKIRVRLPSHDGKQDELVCRRCSVVNDIVTDFGEPLALSAWLEVEDVRKPRMVYDRERGDVEVPEGVV